MNNSSRAFPVNVSIAPPHPAAFERVTEFERSRSYRLTCIGLLVWWIASLYPLMAPHSPEEQLNQEAATTAQEMLIGAIGLGAGFYSQTRKQTLTIARHVLYAAWIAIAVLTVFRIANRNFSELLSPEFTLKGGSTQLYIFPVAYGIISALAFYPAAKMKQIVQVSLLGLVLLLLKGRAMIAGTVAVGLLISSRLARPALRRTIGFFIGLVLLFVRPFIGHGFGAFWNPARFDQIFVGVGWSATVAHNGFLDELLATGILGLILILAFWLQGMRESLRATHQEKHARYLVFGWLLLFLFFNSMGSILQSYFQSPTIFSLTALSSLLALPQPAHSIIASSLRRPARRW